MNVIDFLKDNHVSVLESIGVYARWSTVNPRKVSLNYDQVEAVNGHPVVNECRGLILRQCHDGEPGSPGEYTVMARPYQRFYNLGSGHAPDIDWKSAEFEEKLDGTLCIVYFDTDLEKWCVATRNVPDADVPTVRGPTYAELFWQHSGLWCGSLSENMTYCYELTGPDNRIVVAYDEWKATLLGGYRNDGEYTFRGYAKRFSFSSLDEAREWLEKQPGHKMEGFVVVDKNNNRVKVKSSQYLAVARCMTKAGSDTGLVEIATSGTADDVAQFLPAPRRDRLYAYADALSELLREIDAFAANLKAMTTERKTAAIAIQKSNLSGWIGTLLDIWSGKAASAREWLDAALKRHPVTVERLTECLTQRLPQDGQ